MQRFSVHRRPAARAARRRRGLVGLAATAGLVVSGWSVTDASSEVPTIEPIEHINLRLQEEVTVLDPAINVGNATGQIRVLTAGQLYRFDTAGVPQPELVESSETSEDGLTITMTLKSGLTYSDGTTPVVANDVVAMYERSVEGRAGGSAFFTPFVDSVTAPDELTVVWNLLQPYAQLPVGLAMTDMLIHPAELMTDEDYFDAPVSAGPYMIEDWEPGDQVMHLVENPNYVGGELMVKSIDSITITDMTQTVLQLMSGELDFAFGMPYTFAAAPDQNPDINVIAHPTGGVFQLGLNSTMTDGPLGDPQVRQAISLAIDRAEIAEKAFLGIVEVNPAWVFNTAQFYEPILPNDGAQDLEAARALLAETDWPDGFEMTIDTFGVRDGHTETVLLIQQHLAEIGITVTANPLEIAASLERLNNNTFEGFFQGSVAPSGPSVLVVDSCESGVWGRWMPSGNPQVCELAIQAMTEEDPTATMVEAQELAAESMSIIPLVDRRDLVGTRVPVEAFGPVANTPWLRVTPVAELGS